MTALVDSGSSLTLVRRELVSANLVDYSRKADIVCAHGDRHSYPTAEVTVVVDGQPYLLTVGVVERLPMTAILGWDLSVLLDVLREAGPTASDPGKGVSGLVITRAHARAGGTAGPAQEKGPDPSPLLT